MTKKSILVTGASGFVGRHLVKDLAGRGHAVRAVVRRAVELPAPVEIAIVPDIAGPVAWSAILDGIEIVIHLAGMAHTDIRGADVQTLDAVNRHATQVLARAASDKGVERFIFVSSVRAQAGPSAARPVREDDEARPTDHYGRSKLAAEAAVRAAGGAFTIVRPAVIIGPHPQANIRAMLRLARTRWPLPFAGLTSRRSLLAIDNFISAILFAVDNPATLNQTFLVADPVPLAIRDVFAMLRKAQGRASGLFYVPAALLRTLLSVSGRRNVWQRLGEDLVVDTGRLRALGWRPAIGTYDAIVAMVEAERTADCAIHDSPAKT